MSQEVKDRFVGIAGRYDFMNHFLSMGVDREWRKEAAEAAMLSKKSFSVLDSATGTGDLAFAIYRLAKRREKEVRITGTDFVKQMLDIAIEKARDEGITSIDFMIGDSLRTGFRSSSFDVITTGFSLRNFDDVGRFIRESHRILKKGGRLVVLEMAVPDNPAERMKFNVYSYLIKLSSLFAGSAYVWLVESIKGFDKGALAAKVRAAGFKRIKLRPLASGVAFLLTADK